jgi:hypothetical protein
VARRDALDFEILGRVSGQFEDFGGKVLEDGGEVDGGFGADARLLSRYRAQVALYTAARELGREKCVSFRLPERQMTRCDNAIVARWRWGDVPIAVKVSNWGV